MSSHTPFENMTPADFEARLPELFTRGGRLSDDPELKVFLDHNPTCAALVRDLEYIAEFAEELMKTGEVEPDPRVWDNIRSELGRPRKPKNLNNQPRPTPMHRT